jgi:hypothetical protein
MRKMKTYTNRQNNTKNKRLLEKHSTSTKMTSFTGNQLMNKGLHSTPLELQGTSISEDKFCRVTDQVEKNQNIVSSIKTREVYRSTSFVSNL